VNPNRPSRSLLVGLAFVLVIAIGVLAGCNSGSSSSAPSKTATPTQANATAQKALAIAMSTLSTAAPDGKLLVAQSAAPMTATSTPSWDFLIGSPKSDVIYAVEVAYGAGKFQEYGKAGLTADEWAAVPPASAWKVDSTEAHSKAIVVHPDGKSADYIMGFVTYVPKTAKSPTAKPMTWVVSFDPQSQGKAPTSTVTVDMATGQAAFATK